MSAPRWWYVSSRRMTFAVAVHEGRVVDSAPIGRRFIGQPATNLGVWMRKQGGFRCEAMRADTSFVGATGEASAQNTDAPDGKAGA